MKFDKKTVIIALSALLISNFVPAQAGIAADTKPQVAPKLKESYTSIQLKGGVKLDKGKQVITLNLRESDIRQVLRMLADKAGKNIIIHDSVTGTITIDLADVELNKAIEYIMTVRQLSYWEDGNTIIVATNAEATTLGLKMEEIRGIKIKNVDAATVASFLNSNIFSMNRPNTSNSAIVTTNPSTNEILVFGNKEDIKLAEEVVKYLDIKPRMTTLTVNYTDPVAIASKICWAAFKSDGGEQDISRDADLEEGSNITVVCGNTAAESSSSGSGTLASFQVPSYWVLADTGLNQITIYGGTQEQLNIAQDIINNFDKKEPQVYIEVSVIELSESGSKSLTNALEFTSETDTITSVSGTTTFPDIEIFGRNHHHNLNKLGLVATIEAIVEDKKGRVLANPRIISANNVESTINITSDNISETSITTDADTNERTIDYTISSDEGIEFKILPKITPSGYISLTIEPTFSTVKEQLKDADGAIVATLLNNRELSVKNVRVKDGNTLVLAGLIQETETQTHNKVPFFSEIPILGVLFQNQGSSKTRTELVIMVTPRIIHDPEDNVEKI